MWDHSGLKRALRWVIDPDRLLRDAWDRFAQFDFAANDARKRSKRLNILIFLLVVLSNAISVAILAGDGEYPFETLRTAAVVTTALGAGVLSWAGRRARDQEWVAVRAWGEHLRRGILLYRTANARSGRHSLPEEVDDNRRRSLANYIAEAEAELSRPLASRASVRSERDLLPCHLERAIHAEDELLDCLDGEGYLKTRVEHQLGYFDRRSRSQDKWWAVTIIGILLLVAVATVLVASAKDPAQGSGKWYIASATVIVTVVTVAGTWLRYLQLEQQVRQKAAAAGNLRAIRAGWLSRRVSDEDSNHVSNLVEKTEEVLQRENAEWAASLRQPRDLVTSFGPRGVVS